jgi:hypothetical protein
VVREAIATFFSAVRRAVERQAPFKADTKEGTKSTSKGTEWTRNGKIETH